MPLAKTLKYLSLKQMTESNTTSPAPILALPADLIFGARIRATAESTGANVLIAKNPADLIEKAAAQPRLIILDLDRRGLEIAATIAALKAATSATILAYVSHVQTDAIQEAKKAGADKVIARGAFANQLAELLKLY